MLIPVGIILLLLCVFFIVKYSLKRSALDIKDPDEEIYDSGAVRAENKGFYSNKPQVRTQISMDGSITTKTVTSIGYSNTKSISRNIGFSIEIAEVLNIIRNREKDRYDVVYGIICFMLGFLCFFIGITTLVLSSTGASSELIGIVSAFLVVLIIITYYRQYKISARRIQEE